MIMNIDVTQLQHKQVKQKLEMSTLLCPVRNAQLFHKVWYQKGTTKKKVKSMVQIPRSRHCFQRVGLKILSWKSRFQPVAVLLPQPVCSTARVEVAIEPSMLTPKLRAKEPQTEETDHPQMGESCSLNYRKSWILDNLTANPLKAFVTVVAGMQSKFSSLSPSRISERAHLVLGSKLSKARPKISGKTIKVCHNSPL
jgi:hypothetical protein